MFSSLHKIVFVNVDFVDPFLTSDQFADGQCMGNSDLKFLTAG